MAARVPVRIKAEIESEADEGQGEHGQAREH